MGDISDFYINNMLEKHMNPEKELEKMYKEERRKRDVLLFNLSDNEIIKLSEKSLSENTFNEKFELISRGIIKDFKTYNKELTEKQRKVLYGLLSYVNF